MKIFWRYTVFSPDSRLLLCWLDSVLSFPIPRVILLVKATVNHLCTTKSCCWTYPFPGLKAMFSPSLVSSLVTWRVLCLVCCCSVTARVQPKIARTKCIVIKLLFTLVMSWFWILVIFYTLHHSLVPVQTCYLDFLSFFFSFSYIWNWWGYLFYFSKVNITCYMFCCCTTNQQGIYFFKDLTLYTLNHLLLYLCQSWPVRSFSEVTIPPSYLFQRDHSDMWPGPLAYTYNRTDHILNSQRQGLSALTHT